MRDGVVLHHAARFVAVRHTYPRARTPALDGVTLDLPEGGLTAVIGPSGAGKSTLLRTLNGLVRPLSGEVWVGGANVTRARHADLRRVRASVGTVFQSFNLVRRLTALENVLLGRLSDLSPLRSSLGFYPRADRELAWALLERVGLADYAWQRADTLSGGQQQRVGIARALAQKPRLILADEPVSALDAYSAVQVMELLKEISLADGIAVVANLHALDVVHDYADWVVGLDRGRVVFEGPEASLTPEITARVYGAEVLGERELGPPEQHEVETAPV